MKERDARAYVFMRACCGDVNVCRREREGGREVMRQRERGGMGERC